MPGDDTQIDALRLAAVEQVADAPSVPFPAERKLGLRSPIHQAIFTFNDVFFYDPQVSENPAWNEDDLSTHTPLHRLAAVEFCDQIAEVLLNNLTAVGALGSQFAPIDFEIAGQQCKSGNSFVGDEILVDSGYDCTEVFLPCLFVG